MSPLSSFALDGVMVRPMPSIFPRAVYRVTNPLKPEVYLDVPVAFDLADPNKTVLAVLRNVIIPKVLEASNSEPSWKLALRDLVRPE